MIWNVLQVTAAPTNEIKAFAVMSRAGKVQENPGKVSKFGCG